MLIRPINLPAHFSEEESYSTYSEMKFISLAAATVVAFASQALASPAPQATTATVICK